MALSLFEPLCDGRQRKGPAEVDAESPEFRFDDHGNGRFRRFRSSDDCGAYPLDPVFD